MGIRGCLVLVDAPVFRLRDAGAAHGLLECWTRGSRREVLAVGKNNPRYADVWNNSEIYPHMLKEMTHFLRYL